MQNIQLNTLSRYLETIKQQGVKTDCRNIKLLFQLTKKTKASQTEFFRRGGLDQLVNLYLNSGGQLKIFCVNCIKSLFLVDEIKQFPQNLKNEQHLLTLCKLLKGLQNKQAQLANRIAQIFEYYASRNQKTHKIFAQQNLIKVFIEKIQFSLQRDNYSSQVETDIDRQLQFIKRLIYQSPSQIDIVLESNLLDHLQILISKKTNRRSYWIDVRQLIAAMFTGNRAQISQMLTKQKLLKFVRDFKKIKYKQFSKYLFLIIRSILNKSLPREVLRFLQDLQMMQFLKIYLHILSLQSKKEKQIEQILRLILQILRYFKERPELSFEFVQDFKKSIKQQTKEKLCQNPSAQVRTLVRRMIDY